MARGGGLATSWIGGGLRVANARRARKLSDTALWARESGAIQRGQLRSLLGKASGTAFGRDHGFARLARLGDEEIGAAYRDAVPLADYEDLRPLMERMREGGEPDVTWPGVVMDWAQTSGTTGGQKYIPVSAEMMASNKRAALDIFAHASRFGVSLTHLFGGKLLFLGGCTRLDVNEHGIRTGDLSGLVTPLISWPLSKVYAPGPEVALIDHWPTKIEQMALATIDEDVRFISGMASWSLVLFERLIEMSRERGGRSDLRVRELWPNLSLFVHGGVKYPPFDPRVREAWSGGLGLDIPHRLEVYPASEGFIAMQDTPGDPGLRLNTDIGVYYEFVPVEQIDADAPEAFACDEVERGQRYVVVMSTCAGLWRYVIGDVVEFDTIPPEGPARLRIVGRHRHFINAFGENLIVEEIERAVVEAREQTGARIGEFSACPVYPDGERRGAVELAVEWEGERSGVRAFGEAFDRSLRAINVDYHTKRTDGLGMGPAVVTPVPMGAFHAWMDSRGRLGGQNKCPRCANHREYVEGVRSVSAPAAREGVTT